LPLVKSRNDHQTAKLWIVRGMVGTMTWHEINRADRIRRG
jgi:hypothetical protein